MHHRQTAPIHCLNIKLYSSLTLQLVLVRKLLRITHRASYHTYLAKVRTCSASLPMVTKESTLRPILLHKYQSVNLKTGDKEIPSSQKTTKMKTRRMKKTKKVRERMRQKSQPKRQIKLKTSSLNDQWKRCGFLLVALRPLAKYLSSLMILKTSMVT